MKEKLMDDDPIIRNISNNIGIAGITVCSDNVFKETASIIC